jgi:predicted translin family RNA/ssDNA-binding protein
MILEEKYLKYNNKDITTNVIDLSKEVIKNSKNMISDMKIVRHKFDNTSVNGFIEDYISKLKKSIILLDKIKKEDMKKMGL